MFDMRPLAASAVVFLLCSACLEAATCVELLSCPVETDDAGVLADHDGGTNSSIAQLPDAATASNGSGTSEALSLSDAEVTTVGPMSESHADAAGVAVDAEAGGVCGDGTIDDGEVCDDGNTDDEDLCPYGEATCVACNAGCTEALELTGPTCGDGVLNGVEVCDEEAPWCSDCAVVPMIAAGYYHTCALLNDGSARCWGMGERGQLGDGGTEDQSKPVDVLGLGTDVTAIAAGSTHSCALLRDRTVQCWGGGSSGQLGNGATDDHSTPDTVIDLDGDVAAFATGGSHNCAILSDGTVKCWGNGVWGQLGNGVAEDQPLPVSVSGLDDDAMVVVAGGRHSCALLESGTVKCWGSGGNGRLGDGAVGQQQNTPVSVVGLTGNVTALAAGINHTCALIANDSVKCWGRGNFGQLGDGATEDQSTPVSVVGLQGNIAAIAAGDSHTCALLEGGAVKCWGSGYYGQLGNGVTEDHLAPVSVALLGNGATAIEAGYYHTCALLAGGGVECWGEGDNGRLGNGTTDNQLTPVSVLELP